MKRIILSPKRDTVTICLPPEWVGQSVVCTLHKYEIPDDVLTLPELHDVTAPYNAHLLRRFSRRHHPTHCRRRL